MQINSVPFNDLSRIHQPLMNDFSTVLSNHITNSNFILGESVENFENQFAYFENSKYAVAVNSGTSALILALKAIGIGPGDEVITANFTFVATVFAILECGAIPVLVDSCNNSPNICVQSIEPMVTKRTKAVLFVSMHGSICGLDQISIFCRTHKLSLILDAAQSHGARLKGRKQMSYVDLACFSFYPGKNLGAFGDGGAITTNDSSLAESLRVMRDWGAQSRYHHDNWGGNFRLDAIQASFLSIKLKYLAHWTVERQALAKAYNLELPQKNLIYPENIDSESHVYHIYAIRVANRAEFMSVSQRKGIQIGVHYPKTISEQKYYRTRIKKSESLSRSIQLSHTVVSLPIFPRMTCGELDYVSRNVIEYLHVNEN